MDTLENTSRFAKGEELGPMTVIHLFDQPLTVARPYEAYMGTLAVPGEVTRTAQEHSIHVDLLSQRGKLVEAIELAMPGIRRQHIHVWTLGGNSRAVRLGHLWDEWRSLGGHLVEDGWSCPSGLPAFTESGTYAPTYLVGTWKDEAGAPVRVLFCIHEGQMILLHGFMKKTQKTPKHDLALARDRKNQLESGGTR